MNLLIYNKDDWEPYTKFQSKPGGFGIVSVARKRDKIIINGNKIHNVDLCVIKTVPICVYKEVESQILEILSNFEHSIKYYGSARDDTHVYIYMEYFENVISLDEILDKNIQLNEDQIFKLIKMTAIVLKKIHENNVIHRDIKDEHILFLLKKGVSRDDDNIDTIINGIIDVKFIDFGVSKLVTKKDGSKYISYTGTDAYVAPEVKLRDNTASRKSDVYSLGCVLVRMAGGKLFEKNGTPDIPTNISNRLKNVIQRCIVSNPDSRLDSEGLCNLLNNVKKTLTFEKCDINSLATMQPLCKSIELKLPEQPLVAGSIPNGVESIKFVSFNQTVEFDAIPSSTTYLDLGDEFDIKKNGEDLPNDSIKTLRCGFNFTSAINEKSLPKSLTNLQLHNYNQALNKNSIPSTVSYLTLGNNFTHFESLSHLPPSIINLEFGNPELIDNNFISNNILLKLNASISSLVINGVDIFNPIAFQTNDEIKLNNNQDVMDTSEN